MSRVLNPVRAATAVARPLRNFHSMATHTITHTQPMNTAEEYRFVTGGRPWIHIRRISAQVWTTRVSTISQKARRLTSRSGHSQDTQATTKTITYRTEQR